MNTKLLSLLFLTFGIFVFSQKVTIKKDIIYLDAKECLKITGDSNNVSIVDLNGNEIIFLKFIHNSRYGSVYNKITFLGQGLTLTSQSYIFSKKLLIEKLIESKVLNNCKLDEEKVNTFIMKYDENIER
ncbi:hypothetical protein K0U91_03550 [Chryseobacterium chendengshani]|uniref:hypothetical protein n=1 Tax=Chryseobacterium sp. LJ668 TaxID=2864040 RepID=UPI001C68CD58|nr:hypothetical protein [Chryseobacterium sp. LJ668]MBW8524292.1 hypothetical protein [Chryseobacterium sp. LJ668]QYK17218.1 hypothetical protein K0U91_03550 [Chryseobacterium sp. LJ668]